MTDQVSQPTPDRLRVATVEDDRRLREAIASLMRDEAGFELVGAYASAELALEALPTLRPMVVLMDINLPGLSGIEGARRLKAVLPATQIVMLTAFESPKEIFEALRAGASGYLLKRAPSAEIVAAIKDVWSGGSPMSSSIARQVVQHFAPKPAMPEVATLTEREREVLDALAEGRQYADIGTWLGMSINTVRKHVRNIYEKLQVSSRGEAVSKLGG